MRTNTVDVCGTKNPKYDTTCVARTAHIHHRDEMGRLWPNNERYVSTGDVARMAIDRVTSEFEEIRAEREDKLRQLLSYCDTNAVEMRYETGEAAYGDVADKLRKILDGEQ